jgi:hypothetical protein
VDNRPPEVSIDAGQGIEVGLLLTPSEVPAGVALLHESVALAEHIAQRRLGRWAIWRWRCSPHALIERLDTFHARAERHCLVSGIFERVRRCHARQHQRDENCQSLGHMSHLQSRVLSHHAVPV